MTALLPGVAMKSIRLSLLVYFLVLLTGALAGVSWFSHRMAADALQQQKLDSEKLIKQQCDAQIETARAALDRRLVRQAHALLNRSQSAFIHAEGLWSYAGIYGAMSMPSSTLYYNVRTWIELSTNGAVSGEI